MLSPLYKPGVNLFDTARFQEVGSNPTEENAGLQMLTKRENIPRLLPSESAWAYFIRIT